MHPSVPAKNLKELIALAKQKPGALNYASAGTGTAVHLGAELLKLRTGIDMTHVPYKGGGPAAAATLSRRNAGDRRHGRFDDSVHPERAAARDRLDRGEALQAAAGSADGGGVGLSGVRSERVVRDARPERHAEDHRAAPPRGNGQGAASSPTCRPRCRARAWKRSPSTPAELAARIRNETVTWAALIKKTGIRAWSRSSEARRRPYRRSCATLSDLHRARRAARAAESRGRAREAPSRRHVRGDGLRLAAPAGQKAIEYVKTLGGKPEAGRDRHADRRVRRARRARERHVRPCRRNRRHASAVADASRHERRARGAGDRRARRLSGEGRAARDRARLRHLRAHDARAEAHAVHALGPSRRARSASFSARRRPPARCSSSIRAQVRHVLSYTAQQASGCYTKFRDPEHIEKAYMMGGMPAHNGAQAALMVAHGLTGVDDVFSGERDFFYTFEPEPAARPRASSSRGLGKDYEMLRGGIKRWPVGGPIQGPLHVLRDLMQQHGFKRRRRREARRAHARQGARDRQQPRHARHLRAASARRHAGRRQHHVRISARLSRA